MRVESRFAQESVNLAEQAFYWKTLKASDDFERAVIHGMSQAGINIREELMYTREGRQFDTIHVYASKEARRQHIYLMVDPDIRSLRAADLPRTTRYYLGEPPVFAESSLWTPSQQEQISAYYWRNVSESIMQNQKEYADQARWALDLGNSNLTNPYNKDGLASINPYIAAIDLSRKSLTMGSDALIATMKYLNHSLNALGTGAPQVSIETYPDLIRDIIHKQASEVNSESTDDS